MLVSHAFWQSQLSGANDATGKTLTIDGHAHTIVGVLPSSASTGMFSTIDVMVPIVLDRERTKRDERRLYVTGVLKPGVGREQAEADLVAMARQLQTEYPDTNAKTGVVVRPLIEMLGGNITAVVFLLSLIALIVWCIACANVSSIILAQVATRRRELAVRAALGAGRFHQIRQFMIESLITSSMAGAAGLFLAWWGLVAIRFAGTGIEGFSDMGLNGRVLGVALVLTLLAPLGFALLPALRMSKPDMDELRQGNRGAETARGRRLRESLVVAQIALALILMMQVGLIGRTSWRLHYMHKGFDPAQVLTLRMNLAEADYGDLAAAHDFYMRAIERIRALPGVTAAGTINRLPVSDRQASTRFVIQGRRAVPRESQPEASHVAISAEYFRRCAFPSSAAETFFAQISAMRRPSRSSAVMPRARYWPGQNPVGQRIAFVDSQNEWMEVVGIVEDVRNTDADLAPSPQVYVPSAWRPERATTFVVRSAGPDPVAACALNTPRARTARQNTARLRCHEHAASHRRGTWWNVSFTGMVAVFAIIALLLAAAGVYGLIAFSVSQRTREIGVRMALGAQPASILGMVVARGSVPLTIGLVVGAAGAAALVSVTASALPEIDLRDPLAYVVVAVPLVVVALVATYIPARRATHVDPLLALRAE